MAKKENKNIHELTVKVEGKEWTDALDKTFLEKQKTVKVDGFRKGKVPRSVYEKKFGKESLFFDAVDKVVQGAFIKVLDKEKLEPVVQPTVDIKHVDENGVELSFKVITKPEVNVKKYKGLGIKNEKVEVSDEEINHELSHLLEKYTELVTKEDGKVEDGNVAIIDFEGFKDGVAFDGGKGENYSLEIGSHTFIPGFEEQVIGMKVEEEKDINVTFPEDYGVADLAGSPVVFKVKVHEIKEKKTRELDEDFFEDLGMDGVDSEEKLREEIKTSIQKQKEMEAENKYLDDLLEAVSKNVEVDIPEEMVNDEIHHLKHHFEENMKRQGISLDLYYKFTNTTEEDLNSQLEKEAYTNVLYRLMLEEIKQLEKVEVSDEEAEKEIERLAEEYKVSKEDLLKEYGSMDYIKYDLEMRKLFDLLKEYNK